MVLTTIDFFYLLLLIFLFILSAFFSASETALMRTNRYRIRHMAEQGDHEAQRLDAILKTPDKILGAILLGNNFTNILASVLATAFFIAVFGERGIIYATVAMTVLLLVFCEVIPKTMAAYRAEEVSRLVALPMQWIIRALNPIVRLLNLISTGVAGLLGVDMTKIDSVTEKDIGSAIVVGTKDGFIKEPKAKMLMGILDMESVPVRKAMIPIHDVDAISIDASFDKIVETAVRKNYSRYPVYEGAIDNILGYFHIRDAWQYIDRREQFTVRSGLREAHFVPETKSVLKQLIDFQQGHIHMAFVVDEFGTVKGVITLEDIIEEITGDITDEHDAVLATVVPVGTHSFLVRGNIGLRDLGRFIAHDFPDDVDTLSGLIYSVLDRIPEEGETVRWNDLSMRVERMRGNRITRVRVSIET
jgi:putative hemolysin